MGIERWLKFHKQYWVLIQNDILLVIKNVQFFVEADTL